MAIFPLLLLLSAVIRPLGWRDLPDGLRRRIPEEAFQGRIEAANRDMARRERDGEWDALIYYALQSRAFTALPPVEPALSARRFVDAMPAGEKACYLRGECSSASPIPAGALRRLLAFQRSGARDPRTASLRPLLATGDAAAEYRRAMRFLYLKEFARAPDSYRSRGLSTDTALVSSFTVWNALGILSGVRPKPRIERVLIAGPGLDLASRTRLGENTPPQSSQPYLAAKALRELGLAETVAIDCLDISPRVVAFIDRFPTHPVLQLPAETEASAEPEFLTWRRSLGTRLVLSPAEAESIRAYRANILTQRASGSYDLVIATNILLYFTDRELELAIAGISSMLRPGGYFVHNELRPGLEGLLSVSGMAPVAGRTLRIAPGLLDALAIYRRTPVQ